MITQIERDFLFDYIIETNRNEFSQSVTDIVFNAAHVKSLVYHQNLTERVNPQPMIINMKLIPKVQSVNLFDFTKDAAPNILIVYLN